MRKVWRLAPAILLAAPPLWIMATSANPANAANAADVRTCPSTVSGSTITLTANCDTTATLTIPQGFTLNGAGHTITAHDPAGGNFSGAVVTNAGTSMHLKNLTVRGTGFAVDCTVRLIGVLFSDASGSMTNVKVLDITQHGGCQNGLGVRITATPPVTHQTITITGSTIAGFQKGGLVATGNATVNASGNTIGPPDLTVGPGVIATNGVQYGSLAPLDGTKGTFSGNTVIGAPYGNSSNASTGVLLYNAGGVTVGGNTITGSAAHGSADEGIAVAGTSTGTVLLGNQIEHFPPPSTYSDTYALGVNVDPVNEAETALVCNAFAGMKDNIDGDAQAPCITTTTLPDGTVGHPYSTTLMATSAEQNPKLTWSVVSGKLPPGLTLTPDGTITGKPTAPGADTFTAQVSETVTVTSTSVTTSPVLTALRVADPTVTSTREFTITVLSTVTPPPILPVTG